MFETNRSSKIWIALALVVSIATSTATADTYNFYFKNPPKKKGNQNSGNTGEGHPDMSVQDGENASEPTPVNPLTTPVDPEAQKREEKLRSSQAPIIINNTNNIVGAPGYPSEPPRYASLSSELETMVSAPVRKIPSEYRFGIGPALFTKDLSYDPDWSDYYSYATSPYNYYPTYSTGEAVGAVLSIGIVKSRGVAFNGYFGARKKHSGDIAFHGGVDMELMPVRSNHDDFSLPFFEGGFLLGVSTLSVNSTVSGHTGLRFNFNFSESAGISLVGRGNFTYGMAEAAFITRL